MSKSVEFGFGFVSPLIYILLLCLHKYSHRLSSSGIMLWLPSSMTTSFPFSPKFTHPSNYSHDYTIGCCQCPCARSPILKCCSQCTICHCYRHLNRIDRSNQSTKLSPQLKRNIVFQMLHARKIVC